MQHLHFSTVISIKGDEYSTFTCTQNATLSPESEEQEAWEVVKASIDLREAPQEDEEEVIIGFILNELLKINSIIWHDDNASE